MSYLQRIAFDQVFDPTAGLEAARSFLDAHGLALANAAYLLGGGAASARVDVLISSVREARRLTRPHRRQLGELHRLLMLDAVGDPDRLETELFALIDPAEPVVDDICRLADALQELLVLISRDEQGANSRVGPDRIFKVA